MKKPDRRDYFVDSGMHTAMRDYAKSLNKPALSLYLTHLNDAGEPVETLFQVFERVERDVSYKCHDGETYEVGVHTGKFDPAFTATYQEEKDRGFKGFSAAEIKERFKADPRWHDELVSYRFVLEVL